MPMITEILLVLISYLSGSMASAVIVCRLMGLEDPRKGGSGNPGATNVLRLHGKVPALLALLGDLLKGVLPVLLAKFTGTTDTVIALVGLAAFLGHIYPVFFNFHGGKGIATLIGVLLATSWLTGLLFVATWLLVAVAFRYSSVAGISSTLLAPLYAYWLLSGPAYIISFSAIAALVLWRHRSNVANLLAGTETKIRLGNR